MAQEFKEPRTLEMADDQISDRMRPESVSADPSLSRNVSFSGLNACAPEFVPQAPALTTNPGGANRGKIHHHQHHYHHHQPVMHVVYHHPRPPPPPPVSPQFVVPAPASHCHPHHEYYGGGGVGEYEPDLDQSLVLPPARDGLSEEVIQKIRRQVEYYFSDANLATTAHLMRFITKDPEGFVPLTVIASFKKIKSLIHDNSLLADALRSSSKLAVSEDGKKVRRQQPFTTSDVEELQSRIVVAENLPDDHCYQSLKKVFSVVGSVKTIRTCYPQAPNGTFSATNRSSKMDMLLANKLHAFVEYETVEDAEKAVVELNDGKSWRSGLRVRLLSSCMVPPKQGPGRARKPAHDGDENVEEEDVSTADQPKVEHIEQDPLHTAEVPHGHIGDEEVLHEKGNGPVKREKGRDRGGSKGRERGHYHNNNNNNNRHRGRGQAIGTPPPSHLIHNEETAIVKQPPGPRMPDGTRGFTMGRGKPPLLPSTSTV